jgi:hypothetical protein
MGVVLGAGAVIVLRPAGSSAEAVSLVPAEDAGSDPFTESVQTDEVVSIEQPAMVAANAVRADLSADATTSVLVATGTAPGLYGGSGNLKVCDRQKLVDYLNENPDKAQAFAGVLGITRAGIGEYVAALTPVVLLSDTLVTNHGYEDGRATALTSVLQSGTAVMVDRQGVPRVKCNCGNPLTPPQVVPTADWDVRGDPWDGFDSAAVTGVVGGDAVDELVVSDLVTGEPQTVSVGAGAEPAATDLSRVDWPNRSYPLGDACSGLRQVTLRDGTYEDPVEGIGVSLVGVEFGDLTGDGREEALVTLACYPIGGNANPTPTNVVYGADASGPLQLGNEFVGRDAVIVGTAVQTTDPVWGPNDPRCCPSSIETKTWMYNGTAWVSS